MSKLSHHARAMTAAAFDRALAAHPRTMAHTAAAARAVLVDGLSLAEAGERHGVKRQRLHQVLTMLHPPLIPPDWSRRLVSLPPELMARVITLEAEALATLAQQRQHAE